MSKVMFSKSHEWVVVEGKIGKIGISDYAQKELGDLVYISLPQVGAKVSAGKTLCDVESVKAVSDINSPVTGLVTSVNEDLESAPESINSDAMSAWICEVEIEKLGELMTETEYLAYIKG